MKNYKTFEQINNEDSDRIKLLENEIIKRDELIFFMMRGLSHGYMNFMVDESIDIDELRKRFKVNDDDLNRKIFRNRIDLLHKDII